MQYPRQTHKFQVRHYSAEWYTSYVFSLWWKQLTAIVAALIHNPIKGIYLRGWRQREEKKNLYSTLWATVKLKIRWGSWMALCLPFSVFETYTLKFHGTLYKLYQNAWFSERRFRTFLFSYEYGMCLICISKMAHLCFILKCCSIPLKWISQNSQEDFLIF